MSALRINLLPAYIAETKKTKQAMAAFGTLFAVAVAGSVFYYTVRQDQTVKMEEAANAKEQEATAAAAVVSAIEAESKKLRDQIAPIGERVAFVNQVRFYNTWVQKIYRRAARYTDSRVEYSSMAVNGGALAMTGYVTGSSAPGEASAVDNLARYLITFYGNPDVTAVTVTGPPGWQRPSQATVNPLAQPTNASSARGFGFSVNATLLRALQRPALPASLTGPPTVTEPAPTGGPPSTGSAAAGAPGAAPGGAAPSAPMGTASMPAAPMGPAGGEQER